MFGHTIKVRHGLAVVSLFFLAGCITTHSPDREEVSFAQPAAADVIAAGLDNISDKYIEQVEISRVGVEGLRGLGAIDAGLTLKAGNGWMILFENGEEIGRMKYPADGDSRAWAAAMVAMTETARQHSRDLRNASNEKIYEAIFDGALSDLDIFSRYAGHDQAERNRARRDGFGGIGIRFRLENGYALVTKVLAGGPAFDAGLRVGDRIVEIQGQDVETLKSRDVTLLIRGPINSHVTLGVARADQSHPDVVDVARAHIVPETVSYEIENGIAIIHIKSFNQDTANTLETTIDKILDPASEPVLGLILDLRGNPGGLLRQSIRVADLLLTQGDILRTVGRHPDSLHHYAAGGEDVASGLPVVVLVDGKSASASEIVAAALQDRDRAVVIGTSSYGKGSVQTVVRLPNDGEITLTWSRFVTPSGYYLHGTGVVPTICTSGITKVDEAGPLVLAALSSTSVARASKWKRRGLLNDDERKALRSECPSESRKGNVDLEVAKRLILDPQLHTRALRMTTATAQALN